MIRLNPKKNQTKTVTHTIFPPTDDYFSTLLSSKEFQNLLRPAFQEDEWILIVLGGVTGFIAGTIHLFVAFL